MEIPCHPNIRPLHCVQKTNSPILCRELLQIREQITSHLFSCPFARQIHHPIFCPCGVIGFGNTRSHSKELQSLVRNSLHLIPNLTHKQYQNVCAHPLCREHNSPLHPLPLNSVPQFPLLTNPSNFSIYTRAFHLVFYWFWT